MNNEYPKWLYNRTEPARIVDDPAEQDSLGAGWAETPAAFDAVEAAPKKRGKR